MVLLGGPIACTVSATAGTLTLLAAGFVQVTALPFNWFTWWVGDTIGVLVFAPLLLTVVGEPRASWARRRWAVAMPAIFGFIMVVALFLSVSRREQQRLESEFVRRCEPIAYALQARVDQYVHVGGAVASLMQVAPSIDEAAFNLFAADILARQPGLQALSWIERVAGEDRAEWEAAHGRPITERAADGSLLPAERSAQHFVVSWIAPEVVNIIAVGFDIGSEPMRLAALREAEESGAPAATRVISLVQSATEGAGVLILEPIGAAGLRPSGFSSTVLSIQRLVNAAMSGLETDGVLLRLVDEADGTDVLHGGGEPASGSPWTASINVGGRTWRAEFRPTQAYRDGQHSWQAWGVLAFGLILVALSEFALLVSTGREGRVAAAEDRANALLRAMPDAILRLGPDGTVRDYRPPAAENGAPVAWPEASGLVAPSIAAQFLATIGEVRASGAARRLEYRIPEGAGERDLEARFVAGAVDDVLVVIRDVTAQQRSERLMRTALAEKDVLLREVHHRVKNNLQVITSLLNLAGERLGDDAARAILAHTRDRIRTIALVHDQLHRSDDLAEVGFGAYLETLATRLPAVLADGSQRIQIQVSGDDLTLPLDVAVPCGLIVNELVTNAFLHAFPGDRTGTVHISIRALNDGRAELVVRDDGVGAPADWDPRASGGTGLELVFTFAEQIEAEASVSLSSGVSFTFTFARKLA